MKILGSDYDGTLTQGGIGEEKLSAIAKWRAAGHKFGIVSGRNREFLQTLAEGHPQLKLDFFAACNGGYITDGEGKVLYATRCESVDLTALIKRLLALGATFTHVAADEYVCAVADMKDCPYFVPQEKCRLVENIPAFPYFYQVSVEFSTPEEAEPLVALIREEYGEYLTPLQNGRCIDIVPVGVNKAQGLYRVMDFFGCSYEDVIAVGDNVNDEDMIKEFRSYAMNNGVDSIKKLANAVVYDVSEIIEKEI